MAHTTLDNNDASELALTITRTFDEPCELIWKAWTEIGLLERWICPRDFKVTFCKGELRPGGEWRTGMRSPEGIEYICGGEYSEIVPPLKLVFTHAWADSFQIIKD